MPGVISHAVAVFSGAFLLFQVQPLIAKYILPWFGGSPAVWTTAMLFFQVFLLAGYALAHCSIRWLPPRLQAALHIVLIAAAATTLPITPEDAWKPVSADMPAARILTLLAATIGVPYLALATTAPLMQAWFSRTPGAGSPYRLYALSNFGSLLALLSYPFLVEPTIGRSMQVTLWSIGFGVFGLASAYCAMQTWQLGGGGRVTSPATLARGRAPAAMDRVTWLALSAWPVVLLLAVTNELCVDVAVIPFLWVLPLSLYLLSFVICFDHERWYVRPVFVTALVPALASVVWCMHSGEETWIAVQIAIYCTALFVCSMVCHGELSRRKPEPAHLTGFFLMVALGGALGGVFVALVAPAIFADYWELHLSLVAIPGLVLLGWFVGQGGRMQRRRPVWISGPLVAGYVLLLVGLYRHAEARLGAVSVIAQSRNFYGVLTVLRDGSGTPFEHVYLRHGVTDHGLQLTDPDRRGWATTYFSEQSGAGRALRYLERHRGARRIGIVGLGIGTLATYGREGDYLRIYEINPEVARFAAAHFTYLEDCPATVDVVLGDGRLSLERERPQGFDVLILDAFISDALPVHLLTREAFEIYLGHLAPHGVIAVNISSRHFTLEPVLWNVAEHFDLAIARISNPDGPRMAFDAVWMVLTRDREFLAAPEIARVADTEPAPHDHLRLWTDDYSSPFSIMRSR
jgi:hypothetical protein